MGIFSRIFNRPDGSPSSEEESAGADPAAPKDSAAKSETNVAAPADSQPAPSSKRGGRGGAKKLGRSIGPLELSDSEFPPKGRRRTPRPKRGTPAPAAPVLPPPAPVPDIPVSAQAASSKIETAPTLPARPPAGAARPPAPAAKVGEPQVLASKAGVPPGAGGKPSSKLATPGTQPGRAPAQALKTRPDLPAAIAAKPADPPPTRAKPAAAPAVQAAQAPPAADPPPGAATASSSDAERPAPASSRTPEDHEASLAAELDTWFAVSRRRSSMPPPLEGAQPLVDGVTTAEDLHNVRELFNEMSVHYTGQLRDFMLELQRAETVASWIALCDHAVRQLRTMCDTLSMPELSRALDHFITLLDQAKDAPEGLIRGEQREKLLGAYDQMIKLLPRAFELGTGREKLLVQLLLLQVPGVRQLTVDKLERAGFGKFDTILHAEPSELAKAAGLELGLAQQLVQHFRHYRSSVTAVLAEPVNSQERRRLRELVEQLREQQEAFERASEGWSSEAVLDKRRLRRERTQKLSDIYVVLVRLGETELVSALEKMDVKRQLEEVTNYLLRSRGFAPPM